MPTIFFNFFTLTIEKLNLNEDFVWRTTGVCWSICGNKKLVRRKLYPNLVITYDMCDWTKLEDLFTCNVLYSEMIIDDKFCDNYDASMIQM